MNALWAFVGGGSGAVARYLVGLWIPGFWGVFTVNVVGSFLIAIAAHDAVRLGDTAKVLVITGFLGGFTTYSSFNDHLLSALQDRDYTAAAMRLSATVLGALIAGALGWAVATQLER